MESTVVRRRLYSWVMWHFAGTSLTLWCGQAGVAVVKVAAQGGEVLSERREGG
jgi:hypothetical protein